MAKFSACSLAKSFQELFSKDCERREGGADYTIECDELDIPVHSLVLSARSPVLHTAMHGSFRENREKIYRIKGFKSDSVKHIVRFLYGFEVTEEVEDPAELFRLGDMYEVEDLKHAASNLMGKNITGENVFTIIEIVEKNEADPIFLKCVAYVKKLHNFIHRNM